MGCSARLPWSSSSGCGRERLLYERPAPSLPIRGDSRQASRGLTVTVSAIYEGTVRHRRFAARPHQFSYRLALAYVDLDELPGLLGGRLLRRGPGVARFRRRDYLGDARTPLEEAVRDTVAEHAGVRPDGPIRLLANLSTLGHCFNPVSFYYCMDDPAERVEAVVAEVTNTPWGERHAYVLVPDTERPGGTPADVSPASASPTSAFPASASSARAGIRAGLPPLHVRVLATSLPKALHVSPFMGMDHRYEWRMTVPADTLSVHIASSHDGRLAFDATLALRRRELTRASLARVTARYPVGTPRTLALIYTQAARLKLKGVPVHAHTGARHA
jgi:uncharacterized protein